MTRIEPFPVEIGGKKYLGELATVEIFHLGPEDHGIFTAQVGFAGSGWGQGLPGYALDEYDPATKKRHMGAYAGRFIQAITEQIGSPEQAKGRRVVVFREHSFGDIKGFAALEDDGTYAEPFFPADLLSPIEAAA